MKRYLIYLTAFAFNALQFTPFLDSLSQIDLTQWNLDFADLIVLGEAIKVKYCKH